MLRWPGLRLAAYAALLALAQGLIRALGQPLVHPADTRVRYHSDVLHGLASAVAQTVLRLILLPWEAILNTSAIVTALWRMAVSHRNLLQWQTAAQRAGRRDGLGAYWRALWPASALGLLTAVLTPRPTGLAAGIVRMLSPFVLAALGAPNAAGAAPLSRAAQRELLGWAKATWQYFETFCTAEDHYLPPDNVQSQPPTGTAHRTSPTNMGLALVSALGAHALGIDGGQGLALAERMLTTMEQLPRWNGHFYNWYHTCTLRPMPPLYVSTVDSGNCAAALLTAANALRGWGQNELAARAQMLCDGMDFGPLYDPQRRLMHIGIDTGSGKWSESYYDLLSSEARLTSYFAVARGDVPREHWRALSRAQVQKDHYRGCVSWSGSMFEYLMPELFLPPVRDSLLWESAKFCLYVQRRRVRPGQAWGVSESAYFALDSALSYRYKAHGCAALALQPGMDRELVLSPYSSFLALAVEQRAAMRNLRRLAALGLLGQHGFFDALDCTRARTGGGGQIVRCVMAHHQGMSLLAACNALCGDQVRRWFFADPAMRAHATLLSERLPLGAPALRRRAEQPAETARRRALPDYAAEGTGIDAEAPRCALLSNGTYCLAVSEAGQSFARWHALSVCRRGTRADPAAGPVVQLETDDFSGPLLPGTAAGAQWRFTVRAAQFTARHGDVTAVQTLTVPGRANGEGRALTLSSPRGIEGTVRFVFEAVLAPWDDYVNHPAFARLGFQSVLRRDALLLRPLGRGEQPEAWLCAVCDRPGTWRAEGPVPGWLRAGRGELSGPVHTAPDTPGRVRFARGVGAREDDAFTAAQRALARLRSAPDVTDCFLDEAVTADDTLAGLWDETASRSWGGHEMGLTTLRHQADVLLPTGRRATVAVIDTGAEVSHPLLAGRVSARSYDFADNTADVTDVNGHGTATAGLIADLTPDEVDVMVLRVYGDDNLSKPSRVLTALEYALENGATVVNMSIGWPNAIEKGYSFLNSVLAQAYAAGVVVVAAAGNLSRSNPTANADDVYPANQAQVLTVSAVDRSRTFDDTYSASGASVDLCAPGTGVAVAALSGGMTVRSGTSFAAPHVAAAAACVQLAQPGATAARVRRTLCDYAEDLGAPGRDDQYGNGFPVLTQCFHDR